MTAVELAELLAEDLRLGRTTGDMLRAVRQLVMDADRSPDVSALIADEAPPTGDQRWDALIAGVVEFVAARRGVTTPSWVTSPERFLTEWWFVTEFPRLRPTAFVETPAAIANRGVFLRRATLENV